MDAIRKLYETYGAEGYYSEHGDTYANPHFPEISALIAQNLHRIPATRVYDFAAGGGEVTLALRACGIDVAGACDPYTQTLYEKQTGMPCAGESFMDVIRNGLSGNYSAIICSFAMHLCPQKSLFPLCWNLFQAAPLLVIITPHKRPQLELLSGIECLWDDFSCTPKGKHIRMKAYVQTAAD